MISQPVTALHQLIGSLHIILPPPVCTVYHTLYAVRCVPHTVCYMQHPTLYRAFCTLYSLHHIPNCTLYTVHCTGQGQGCSVTRYRALHDVRRGQDTGTQHAPQFSLVHGFGRLQSPCPMDDNWPTLLDHCASIVRTAALLTREQRSAWCSGGAQCKDGHGNPGDQCSGLQVLTACTL